MPRKGEVLREKVFELAVYGLSYEEFSEADRDALKLELASMNAAELMATGALLQDIQETARALSGKRRTR